jgi:hypothetical protein
VECLQRESLFPCDRTVMIHAPNERDGDGGDEEGGGVIGTEVTIHLHITQENLPDCFRETHKRILLSDAPMSVTGMAVVKRVVES